MKKWFLVLACAAALSNGAWAQYLQREAAFGAQQPETLPPGVPSRPPAGPAATPFGPSCPNGDGSYGGFRTKTVCVPEPSVKIKVSIKYSSIDDTKCYRKCFWPFFGGGDCDQCARNGDGQNCGHPWPKRTLVKRIVTEEIPITKCTPMEVPAYGRGDCAYPMEFGNNPPSPQGFTPPPQGELIPAPRK